MKENMQKKKIKIKKCSANVLVVCSVMEMF